MFPSRQAPPSSSTPAFPLAASTSQLQLPQGHLSSINLALPPSSMAAATSTASIGLSPSSATTTPVAPMNGGPSPTPQLQDTDLFAQLARLKHVQLSLALDHANSPDAATTPTVPTGGAFGANPGISPFTVAGLTSGSNSTAGGPTGASTPAGPAAAAAGSSRGTGRNQTGGGGAAADPALEDAGVSPEAAANKTKDRFAVKREQAAVMTAKLADLRAVMRDITTTARTLHSQAATSPPPPMPTGGQPPAAQPQPGASLAADPPTTRPISFLSPLAPSAIPSTPAASRSPALGLVPRGPQPPAQPTSILSPSQANGLTGSPELVGGLMGPSADGGGVWAGRNGSRVVDR